MAKYTIDEKILKDLADAIRSKTGKTAPIVASNFPSEIQAIPTGGSGGPSVPSAPTMHETVNFYDYDGTLLHSYSVEEAQTLSELPPLPEQSGLICQGWNWSLEDIKTRNRAVNVGATYITDDGTTRIYIRLEEGRTSPVLGVCPKGTVTVDWGDGTEPDVLTGSSETIVKYTPNHNYAAPGDYVIRLTVDGGISFYQGRILSYAGSSTSNVDNAYRSSIQKIELGAGSIALRENAFSNCYSLASITIPEGVASISDNAFSGCYSLASITIPEGVTSIGNNAFSGCYSLSSITIPEGVTSIGNNAFYNCNSLASITIPEGVTSISNNAFYNCYSLASITIPEGVTSISNNAFYNCYSIRFVDFSNHTAVPTLANTNAFTSIPADCEIRVPAALYDEWIAATNWSTYASQIVAV